MKNYVIFITLLFAGIASYTMVANAAQRRAGTTAARGIFSRGSATNLGRTSTKKSFASTPATCPKGTRSFFTESGSTLGARARRLGQQAGAFAARHPMKLFVAGTAATTYGVGKTLSEREKRIKSELEEFKTLITHLSYQSGKFKATEDTKNLIAEAIKKLKAAGAINREYPFYTPLVMVIKDNGISQEDKIDIIKSLLENGAKPQEEAIIKSLGLWGLTLDTIPYWQFNNDFRILKVILPYANEKTISKFIEIINSKINENHNDLKTLESEEERFNEYKKRTIDHLKWKINQSKNEKEKEALKSDLHYWHFIASDERLENERKYLQSQKASLKRLKNIADKSRQTAALAGTSAYKEEDWTVAR